MFDTGSWPNITKLVVESANSGIGSAYSTADSGQIWARIGVWVRALRVIMV